MNMEQLMKQAQAFQQKMGQIQEELGQRTVTASAGGGMVTVTVNGKQEVLSIDIEPVVIDPAEPAMLQDLLIAAVNEALKKAQELARGEMGKLTGGISIPGLF